MLKIRANANTWERWEYVKYGKLDILDNWIICEIGIFRYELHGIDEISYNCKFVIEAN